ncbi:MAG: CBS domain-containing protein [Firmicutes bacterium]|nr:CBS domain-containing protein [Bacillota bacterium]
MESNARRFINAYNTIDYAIRVQHNFKRSMSFSDLIRRAVPLNYLVRKYEDDLIDFGRLRNAIIHGGNEDYIIAEPHIEIVEKIEKIADAIKTPPKALDVICHKDVLCAQSDIKLIDVIELISTSEFSNIPIYKDGGLIGIANGQRILDEIGKAIERHENVDGYINNTLVEEIIKPETTSKYYEVVDMNVTIEKVLNQFYSNRKLIAVLITKTGNIKEIPLGIVTASDVIIMNNILDNY